MNRQQIEVSIIEETRVREQRAERNNTAEANRYRNQSTTKD